MTVDNANRALYIYRPDIESIKGEMTRRKPKQTEDTVITPIPRTILDLHPNVNLLADFLLWE